MKCPVCDDATPKPLLGTHAGYRLHACAACDVGFSDPMQGASADWYAHSPLYLNAKALDLPLGWHHRRFLSLAGPGAGRRLLDVGCGTGHFLARARDRGFVPAGIDFDATSVEVAERRHGLTDVHVLSLDDYAARFPAARFDFVTLFEVIEHVDDPRAFLAAVRRLLLPGGRVALSTPNRTRRLDALGEGDLPPNHLTRWTAAALQRLLRTVGFEILHVEAKRLGADDAAGWLRSRLGLGLARRLLATGVATGDARRLEGARSLMRVKDACFAVGALPVVPLGRALGWQGSGLLGIARMPP